MTAAGSPFAAHTVDEAAAEVVEVVEDFVELNETGLAWHAEWLAARQAETEAKERVALARQNLEAILGDRVAATISGRPVVTWKPATSRSFDQAAAREFLTDEQWAACQRVQPTRQFREVK